MGLSVAHFGGVLSWRDGDAASDWLCMHDFRETTVQQSLKKINSEIGKKILYREMNPIDI